MTFLEKWIGLTLPSGTDFGPVLALIIIKTTPPLRKSPTNFLYADTSVRGQTLTEVTFLSLLGSHTHTEGNPKI